MSSNPYTAPKTEVADFEAAHEYQEVRMWSSSGRLGRLRYLAYTTGAFLVVGCVGVLLVTLLGSLGAVLAVLLYIAAFVFTILVTIQRSHDMDWSGWTILLNYLLPFVGLIWIFKAGSPGPNTYGGPPPPNTTGVKILGLVLPVVFIIGMIGVLAAIAIPAYQDYTERAMEYQQQQQSYDEQSSEQPE